MILKDNMKFSEPYTLLINKLIVSNLICLKYKVKELSSRVTFGVFYIGYSNPLIKAKNIYCTFEEL